MLRLCRNLRLMPLQPEQLRQRPGRRRHLVRDFENALPMFLFQGRALFDAALVGPHDRAANRAHRAVEQHSIVGRAVERHRAELREIDAGSAHLRERSAHRTVPVGRLLLGPAGAFVVSRVLPRRLAEQPPGTVDRGDLAAAGTEVDPEQHGIRPRHLTSPSRAAGPSRRSVRG